MGLSMAGTVGKRTTVAAGAASVQQSSSCRTPSAVPSPSGLCEREGPFTVQNQVAAPIIQSRIPDCSLQQFSSLLVPGLVEERIPRPLFPPLHKD